MIKKNKIEKIRYSETFTWMDIDKPDEMAIRHLRRNFKFHPLDLEDCISETQRAKIDDYEDYLFMVLHVPVKSARARQLNTSEIKLFISSKFVITLHEGSPTIKKLFSECKKRKNTKEEYLSKGPGYFLYMLIDDLFAGCFPLLDDISKGLNDLERDVFDSEYSHDCLKDILVLKKDIINFRRIIIPQRVIIAQLEHKNKKFLPENLDVYFDDVVDKIEKIWNNLENLQELIASLQETNESIISHNTNNIIKVLTIFSVIMLPLTFITGFYGMNLGDLPFATSKLSVEIVIGILVGVVVSMISYFKYKKWM